MLGQDGIAEEPKTRSSGNDWLNVETVVDGRKSQGVNIGADKWFWRTSNGLMEGRE